ncbi:MAG: transporter substrate-binding domain-containing protein [Oscillospiraceae bacterium]|nr:transporter substrate-binding domain-containing protein [Oscillospiraceae bacterium]
MKSSIEAIPQRLKRFLSIITMVSLLAVTLVGFSGCFDIEILRTADASYETLVFNSYRDIPGITDEEIVAIAELREKHDELILGTLFTEESFICSSGGVSGFTALFSEWMTELFEINFVPRHLSWLELFDGFETGTVHFTSELTSTAMRQEEFFMTTAITQRTLKYFRLADSPTIAEVKATGAPRYILRYGSALVEDIFTHSLTEFEVVWVNENEEVYEILRNGEADAFISIGIQRSFFSEFDIVTEPFFPLLYTPVSLSAHREAGRDFEVIINIFQKALDAGIIEHINELYDQGRVDYLVCRLNRMFTDEERELVDSNIPIRFAAEHNNYPISFWNSRYDEWQGIAFDVLKEIEKLTGLQFEIINDSINTAYRNIPFYELKTKLESGEVDMISELIRTENREERFLWPDTPIMVENTALLSSITLERIALERVYHQTIGALRQSAHTEFFNTMFPNHPNIVYFDNQHEVLEALSSGQIDLAVRGHSTLLYLTNYLERSDFKANLIFDNGFMSTFGISPKNETLHSIIDKAMYLIDIEPIIENWRHRVYNYRIRQMQEQIPLVVGAFVVTLLALVIATVFFVKNRNAKCEFRKLVDIRTHDLSLQTVALHSIIDTIPDIIYTKDRELRYMHYNQAFLNRYKTDRKNMKLHNSMSNEELLALDDEFNEINLKVMEENITIKLEEKHTLDDGKEHYFEITRIPLTLKNGEVIGVLGIYHDITEHREVTCMLSKESQSKSSFLANMSHEIRTPLNAIAGTTNILLMKEDSDEGLDENIAEGLNKIHISCNLLLGIIDDILDLSKIESGKLNIISEEYNVASLISDIVQINLEQAHQNSTNPIEFELIVDPELPVNLIGDQLRIKQILNNLLSNAFKYTTNGKITLLARCEPYKSQGKSDKRTILTLCVTDTGCGMTKEQLGKVFDEYSRYNKGYKDSIDGNGLGLTVVQKLTNLMSGKIDVDSEIGKGTTFTLRLCQEIANEKLIGEASAKNLMQFKVNDMSNKDTGKIKRTPLPDAKILVVDDVTSNLYVATGLIKPYGITVDVATSGPEAIFKIRHGEIYDIIFMDHMMPKMDGIEATKRIRELNYNKPIIALTANVTAGQSSIFLQNGFDDFISKPIDMRRLDIVLNKFIRGVGVSDSAINSNIDTHAIKSDTGQQVPSSENAQSRLNPAQIEMRKLLLDSFLQDAKGSVEALKKLLQDSRFEANEDSLQEYVVYVHGMKSSLFNIGETLLSKKAYNLEVAGRECNSEVIHTKTPVFLEAVRELFDKYTRELKSYTFDSSTEEPKKDISQNELLERFAELQEECEYYQRKSTFDLINGLKKHNLPPEIEKALEDIKAHIMKSDFDDAAAVAEKVRETIEKK